MKKGTSTLALSRARNSTFGRGLAVLISKLSYSESRKSLNHIRVSNSLKLYKLQQRMRFITLLGTCGKMDLQVPNRNAQTPAEHITT